MTTETVTPTPSEAPTTSVEVVTAPTETPTTTPVPEPTQISTEPVVAPDPEVPTTGPDALTPEQFNDLKTGHAGADAALNTLLQTVSVDFVREHITEPLENGKTVDQLDTKLLTEKLGADKAALVLAGIKDFHVTAAAELQARETAIVDAAGSPENVKTLITWAQNKCASDPAFLTQVNEINALLGHSPVTARAGIALLKSLYEQAGDTSSLNKRVVSGDGAGGITAAEYIDKYEAHKLLTIARKAGDREAERQITARRAASALTERNR